MVQSDRTERQSELQEVLYRALGEPIGLLLHSGDPVKARQMFYRARAAAKDPDLSQLQIRLCEVPPRGDAEGGNIVLVKGEKVQGQEAYQPEAPASGPNLKEIDL